MGTYTPTHHDILQSGHIGEQTNILKGTSDPRLSDFVRLLAGEVDSVKCNCAGIGRVEARE